MSRILLSTLKHSFSILNYRCYNVQNRLFLKSSLPCVTCYTSKRNFGRTAPDIKSNNVENMIFKLDQNVKRLGRTSFRDVQDILLEITKSRSITSTQALLLIRSCGNLLVEEKPQTRIELTKAIWNTITKLGIRLDVSHYNALLRVYLENEYEFAPTDILSSIEKKGIEPNRVTCQRLIARYCQVGDIDGATRILEYMREKAMPVNEAVFNSLILGHSQAKNMEGAEGVLKVMKDGGIEPSAETYTTLMKGYVNNGNLQKLEEWMKFCNSTNIIFSEANYFDIIYSLTMQGHEDRIDQVMSQIRKSASYSSEAMNFTFKLLTSDKTEVAYKILKSMDKFTRPDGSIMPIGNFFVAYLVRNDKPIDTIIKYCNDLMASNMNPRALAIAMENSLRYLKQDVAVELFRHAKKLDFPIRHHYFWPLLSNSGRNQDFNGMFNLIKLMNEEFGLTTNSETLREYMVPYLLKSNMDIEKILNELKSCGLSFSSICGAVVLELLKGGKIKKAVEIANHYPTAYPPRLMRIPLNDYLLQTRDVDSYVLLAKDLYRSLYYSALNQDLDHDVEKDLMDHRGYSGSMLEYVIRKFLDRNDTQTIEKLIKGLHEQQLGVNEQKVEKLKSLIQSKVSSETLELLGQLSCEEFSKPSRNKEYKYTSDVLDEAGLKRLQVRLEQNGEPTTGVKKQLFIIYTKAKDLEKSVKIAEELEAEGVELTTAMQVFLIDVFVSHSKLEEAMKVFDKLCEITPDFNLNPTKTLCLVELLVKEQQYDKAIEILKRKGEACETDEKSDDNMNSRVSVAWRILNLMAEKGDADRVKQFFDILAYSNLVVTTNSLLGPLIKAYLQKGDHESAFQEFENCIEKYKLTPMKNELLSYYIKTDNGDMLQKVTDLSTAVHGESSVLCDIMIVFLELGRLKEARKILETQGVRLRRRRLESYCDKFVSMDNVEHLMNLLKITKGIHLIDQGIIYRAILRLYDKNNDVNEAIALWTEMQEEDVQPSDGFLIQLASLLNRNDVPVPFNVPADVTQKSGDEGFTAPHRGSYLGMVIRNYIQKGDYDTAILVINKGNMKHLGKKDASMFISGLLRNGRYEEAKQIFNDFRNSSGILTELATIRALLLEASNVGDVQFFNDIGKTLDVDVLRLVSFHSKRCRAYVNAKRSEELVSELERKLKEANTTEDLDKYIDSFPRSFILILMDHEPELVPRMEALIKQCMTKKESDTTMANVLWMYYVKEKNFNEADNIWTTKLQDVLMPLYNPLLFEIIKNRDLEMGEKLLSYLECKPTILPRVLGSVYSTMINIYIQKDAVEDAMKFLKHTLTKTGIENLRSDDLQSLKNACEDKNIEFPYTIPVNRRYRDNREAHAGSSSNSD